MKIKFTLQLLLGLTLLGTGSSVSAENWPTWRGPQANGVAPGGNPPTEFSEEKNVQWKIKVPGSGSSTPVIWGDQVFILTAVATGKKWPPPRVARQPIGAVVARNAARGLRGGAANAPKQR